MTPGGRLHQESWNLLSLLETSPGLAVLADTLADLVHAGHSLVVGTEDLKYPNGLARFQQRHPQRFLQFGISEQHMVTAAAGMTTLGLIPYLATFASFLALLCWEQIRTDVAYPGLPVRLIGHHSGITLGFYGTSHHATEDMAIMRSIPGMVVIAPAEAPSLATRCGRRQCWTRPSSCVLAAVGSRLCMSGICATSTLGGVSSTGKGWT